MARIRTIKPDMWLSPQVMNLELGARLLFIGLITQADDQGRGVADPRRLKAAVLPADDVTAVQVDGWVSAIEAEGLAILYTADGHGRLYQLVSWHIHQSINKPKPSNYPPPPGYVMDKDGSDTGTVRDDSRGIGGEGNGKEGKGTLARATPGLKIESWEAWLTYRKSIGKPIKPASLDEAAKKLASFGKDQDLVVRQSIANGWQGLFALKDVRGTAGKPPVDPWPELRHRASKIGFRDPSENESPQAYHTYLSRAEDAYLHRPATGPARAAVPAVVRQ